MGVFDVSVAEDEGYGTGASAFQIRWKAGRDAGVQFILQPNSRTAICFMPDDIYFHNRLILAEQPWLIPEGLYLQQDRKSGDYLKMELDCLREVIYTKRTIYKIMRGDTEVTFKWTKEEAEEYLKEPDTRMRGGHPVVEYPFAKCKIVTDEKFDKTDEVKDMIRRNRGLPFGWTNCDEFRDNIIKRVSALVNERTNTVKAVVPGTNFDMDKLVAQLMDRMTSEQLQDALKKKVAPASTEAASPSVPPAPKSTGKYSKTGLTLMKKEEVQAIATSMGVAFDAETVKQTMVEAILRAQEKVEAVPATAA
jgi:hypothetical protein